MGVTFGFHLSFTILGSKELQTLPGYQVSGYMHQKGIHEEQCHELLSRDTLDIASRPMVLLDRWILLV